MRSLETSKISLWVSCALVICLAGGSAWAASQDGFGDGDRNNDTILDDPDGSGTGVVDDALDTGWAFWRVFKTSAENQVVRVAHDPGGLGDDNAFIVDVTGDQAYQVANIDPVSLVNPGDYIKLSFAFRFVGTIPDNRDTFRFGFFNSNNTVVSADQTGNTQVADDPGYFGTIATGTAPNRARIAENGPSASAGSLFAMDRTIVIQDPSLHNINDNAPHNMAVMAIRVYGGKTVVRLYQDGSLIMQGEDTLGPLYNFNEIGFGIVPTPVVDYNLDDIQIETGTVPACDSIGSVNVVAPLPTGATTINVSAVAPEAEEIRIYANGTTLIGTATGAPPATPAIILATVTPLVAGDVISAKQVVGGVESCVPLGTAVTVNNCNDVAPISLVIGFKAGDTQVTAISVSPIAQQVKVYANGTTLLGSAPGNGTDQVVVAVSPALKNGDTLMATQIINNVEGCMPTSGLVVRSSAVTLVEDGFGDGDRNNDTTPEGPVDNAADVGVPWWMVTDASHTVTVAHDAASLGDDNALFADTGVSQRYLVAQFAPVSLESPGDYIEMTFDVRLVTWPSNRDTFRFGLFDDVGTSVTADQTGTTKVADDIGYFATWATGNPVAGSRDCRLSRAGAPNTASGTLFGLDEGLLDEETSPYVINDANPHTIKLTIIRVATDRVQVEARFDGNLALQADDTSDVTAPVVTSFNQVGFGEVGGSPTLDYAIDNVKIIAQISTCSDPVFDVDGNNRVNLLDASQFMLCATGPVPAAGVFAGLTEQCQCLDANKDEAIDMLDFAMFQRCVAVDMDADPACDN